MSEQKNLIEPDYNEDEYYVSVRQNEIGEIPPLNEWADERPDQGSPDKPKNTASSKAGQAECRLSDRRKNRRRHLSLLDTLWQACHR
ncbi:MAG: hypothetical protein NTX98_00245 [Candidatus Doudnabacteria bacterium]|nr:hypothetical protein [Candidatus Doudnabacteria bacterium]